MYYRQEQNYNLYGKVLQHATHLYYAYYKNEVYFCALDLNFQPPQGTLTIGILLPGDNAMITCVCMTCTSNIRKVSSIHVRIWAKHYWNYIHPNACTIGINNVMIIWESLLI